MTKYVVKCFLKGGLALSFCGGGVIQFSDDTNGCLIMKKITFSEKIYYKAIAKLLALPVVFMIVGSYIVLYFGSIILASATLLYGAILLTMGFFTYPLFLKLNDYFNNKIDPIYSKYIEQPLKKERDSAKRGIVGEKEVHGWLQDILPKDQFTIISNLVLPGHKSDIDIVVIGPNGIFVFEVKNFTEKLFFTTEDYAYISKNGELIKLDSLDDPRNQLRWNVERLEGFLANNNIPQIKAKKALVFPEADSMIYLGSPVVYLIDNKDSLKSFIFNNPNDARFTSEFRKKILSLISP